MAVIETEPEKAHEPRAELPKAEETMPSHDPTTTTTTTSAAPKPSDEIIHNHQHPTHIPTDEPAIAAAQKPISPIPPPAVAAATPAALDAHAEHKSPVSAPAAVAVASAPTETANHADAAIGHGPAVPPVEHHHTATHTTTDPTPTTDAYDAKFSLPTDSLPQTSATTTAAAAVAAAVAAEPVHSSGTHTLEETSTAGESYATSTPLTSNPETTIVPLTAETIAQLAPANAGRPTSLLSHPLTHPNGASMFPTLTQAEQEDLAREALDQAQVNIIAESFHYEGLDENGSDGGYASDGNSSASTSAESSVRDYLYENGRRYHSFREGTYNFPNDDVEQEREDMKHAMVKLLCSQKLHFSPLGEHPQQILDMGTGTGIWAIEMGDQYPSAQVLGVDLSPIQPDWLPPNVKFLVDDIESPWLYPRNHFDYIHSRHTVMAFKNWDKLFRRSLEHLKPGAWIELQEIHHSPRSAGGDGNVPPDHPIARFWSLVSSGLGELGINLNIAADGQLATAMQSAGFVNVTERVLHVPIGTWPKNKVLKTVGLYWRTILLDGLQAIALGPLTRGLRWKREEVEVFLADVRRAYHDNVALMYMPLHVVYGQKPVDAY